MPPRWAASLAGIVGLLAMTALYLAAPGEIYAAALWSFGVEPGPFPFVDISYYLAAWECTRAGWTEVERIPCDVLGRAYSSGPLWLDLAWIPLTQAQRPIIGWAMGLAFMLSLALLPVPARGRAALVARLLAVVSPTVVFAVERANFDVLLFLCALGVVGLSLRGGLARWAAYGLIWLMAAMKFYPLSLLALALRERPRRVVAVSLASLVVLGVYLALYGAATLRGMRLIPGGRVDTDMFSARNLPLNIGLGVWRIAEGTWFGPPAALLAIGLVVAALGFGCWQGIRRLVHSTAFAAALRRMDARSHVCLVMSCVAMVGCFFTAQNIAYRAVWLLLAVPALSDLARNEAAIAETGRRAMWLVVFVLWGEFFRQGIDNVMDGLGAPAVLAEPLALLFWLLRELAWWWLIMLMLAVLWRFAADSPSGRLLRRSDTRFH